MSLKSELESADRKKRSSDLDAREALVAEKEALFAERVQQADTLEKQINANRVTLKGITDQLVEIRTMYEQNNASYREKLATMLDKVRSAQREYDDSVQKLVIVETNAKAARKSLSELKDEIRTQTLYRDEQETIVQNTIERWNIDLREFQHELEDVQATKTKMSSDIIKLEQDRSAITREVERLDEKFIALDESYTERAASLRDKLQAVNTQIAEAKSELSKLEQEQLIKIDSLRTKEKSLVIQEQSQRLKEQELDQKERRLKMNYGIAGMSYD